MSETRKLAAIPVADVGHGRRTGGSITDFHSVVDPLRCAIEIQNDMADRNADALTDRRSESPVSAHFDEVVEG